MGVRAAKICAVCWVYQRFRLETLCRGAGGRVLTGQLSTGEAESVHFLDGIADSSPALMSLSSVFVKWVFCLLMMGKLRKTVWMKHFNIL